MHPSTPFSQSPQPSSLRCSARGTSFRARGTDPAPWLRTGAAFAFSVLFVWVMAPGIASVWAGTPFEATAAAFLVAFVLFVPVALLSQLGAAFLWECVFANGKGGEGGAPSSGDGDACPRTSAAAPDTASAAGHGDVEGRV